MFRQLQTNMILRPGRVNPLHFHTNISKILNKRFSTKLQQQTNIEKSYIYIIDIDKTGIRFFFFFLFIINLFIFIFF